MPEWKCDLCGKPKKVEEPTNIDISLDVTLEFDWLKKYRSDVWAEFKKIQKHDKYLKRRHKYVKKEETKEKYSKQMWNNTLQWDALYEKTKELTPFNDSFSVEICRKCLKKMSKKLNLSLPNSLMELL